jgi:ABC-type sugar transport system substrate-binding protein
MKSLLLSSVMFLAITATQAQDLKSLNSDTEPDRIDWSQLTAKFGPFPKPPSGTTVGAVSKTLTNEYWRLLGEGYQNFGKKVGVPVAYQAAQNEGDQLGQLSIAETMITQGASVLLVSPQTNANLEPAMGEAKTAEIPVVNVNDAVIAMATHYVGNVQRDNGVRVAKWFLTNRPQGGNSRSLRDRRASMQQGNALTVSRGRSRQAVTSSRWWPAFPATGTGSSPTTRRRQFFSSTPISSVSIATTTLWRWASSKP